MSGWSRCTVFQYGLAKSENAAGGIVQYSAMFTGIVEELGAIISIDKTLVGTRMAILASAVMADLKIGDSISVNGTCLTVVNKSEHNFSVEVSPETLSVTTLGQLTAGAPLNLERAMKLNERLGGHLVAGHVDGIGTIRSRQQDGNAILFMIEAPSEILRQIGRAHV